MARSPEEVREAKRLHMARRRAENPDAVRAYNREFHRKNRERNTAKMREYYARRFFWSRAMKLRGKKRATTQELASLWRKQRGRCTLTGRRLDRAAQLDHILPKSRGGGDELHNLRWVCEAINIAKRHLTDDEFMALCSDVMRWIGDRIRTVSGEYK